MHAINRHSSIMSALLNEDSIGRGNMWASSWLSWLTSRRLLSRDGHLITMWLSLPIRARLTFCGYVKIKLILVDRIDQNVSMLPDLNTGVRDRAWLWLALSSAQLIFSQREARSQCSTFHFESLPQGKLTEGELLMSLRQNSRPCTHMYTRVRSK